MFSKKATKYSKAWEALPEFKDWLSCEVLPDGTERSKRSWCNSNFSISHGGKNDVVGHMNRVKHKEVQAAKLATRSVVGFFGKLISKGAIIKSIFASKDQSFRAFLGKKTKEDSLVAAKEATLVCHMVRHNQSFRSMKCTSEIIHKKLNKLNSDNKIDFVEI